jgi:hypothetical protein
MAAASKRFLEGYWYGQPRGLRRETVRFTNRQKNADIVTRMMPHIVN